MVAPSPKDVARLLVDWGNGDQAALNELIPLVYDGVLKVTSRTVEREWRKAKAWLNRAITKGEVNEA